MTTIVRSFKTTDTFVVVKRFIQAGIQYEVAANVTNKQIPDKALFFFWQKGYIDSLADKVQEPVKVGRSKKKGG